jgi:Type II secretion system (T2SS), protein G
MTLKIRRIRFMVAVAVLTACGCIVVHVNERSQDAGRLQTDIEQMRQAMADMRTIGTAFESFAVDTNLYPAATEPDRMIGDVPFSRIETLSTVLKIYVKSLPKIDPWDSPYLFWSDGKQHYVVICLGADAAISQPATLVKALHAFQKGEEVARAPSHCMEDDIVFTTGQFVWYPRDWVYRCGRSAKGDD